MAHKERHYCLVLETKLAVTLELLLDKQSKHFQVQSPPQGKLLLFPWLLFGLGMSVSLCQVFKNQEIL